MTDLAIQSIEFELGLDEEMEGWLAIEFPKMHAELESSREKADEHPHRKLVTKIVNVYQRQFPATLEWAGSAIGRPVYIVAENPRGPHEVSLDELTKALAAPDPRSMILQIMGTKLAMGGGTLKSVDSVQ